MVVGRPGFRDAALAAARISLLMSDYVSDASPRFSTCAADRWRRCSTYSFADCYRFYTCHFLLVLFFNETIFNLVIYIFLWFTNGTCVGNNFYEFSVKLCNFENCFHWVLKDQKRCSWFYSYFFFLNSQEVLLVCFWCAATFLKDNFDKLKTVNNVTTKLQVIKI